MKEQKTQRETKAQISVKIPKALLNEIDRTAKEQGVPRTKVIEYRLHVTENPITPAIMANIQNVINLSLEGAKTGSQEKVNEAQMEANKLCQL